jgi:hypothetical protein
VAAVSRLLFAVVFATLAAPACAAAPEKEGDDPIVAGGGAQSSVLPDAIATIEVNPETGGRVARIGPSRYALSGERVTELETGRRYKLSLASTREERQGGFEVRRLVDFSRVIKLVGTLSDDVQDVAVMHLRSLHAKSYAIYGETVGSYKDIRATLPAHDYTKTLFTVSAVPPVGGHEARQDRNGSARWEWLDYAPIARYKCAQSDSPGTRLDLVDVKPDDSLLDGFIAQPLGGREVRYGAHAACTRDGAAYTCALDSVGTAWGTTRFVPGAGEAGRFDLVVERADAARTKLKFGCETVTAASLIPLSED